MTRVAILGAGAGGLSAAVELTQAGFECILWNRGKPAINDIIRLGKIHYKGLLGEGEIKPSLATMDLKVALKNADVVLVVLPTIAHSSIAKDLCESGWSGPTILNPGHTGGALEFHAIFKRYHKLVPPLVEFSTLTYVARKLETNYVNITGKAKSVRAAALPGGESALKIAQKLYPDINLVPDVLYSSLSNVNLVLHPPGAILGASWVEATSGNFTFYRDGLTEGVSKVMGQLDRERVKVALKFGHEVPSLVEEMALIGTVEATDVRKSLRQAISSGKANASIMAPNNLQHRYYVEDFGHGLLPFIELAKCAGIEVPTASALLEMSRCLIGDQLIANGRNAASLGISDLGPKEIFTIVRGKNDL
ncbi:MAG: NAD/NADP octopine/nopaline dehydrogenase family protein [Pseudomonadota bacterium]|nr:NAD/NADP octopine/nopaline dehydrogenase family protein [Pseudomonadota bacterium]